MDNDTPTTKAKPVRLSGLQRICRLHGRINCGGKMMAWDYARNVAVAEKVLKADPERFAASERARLGQVNSGVSHA